MTNSLNRGSNIFCLCPTNVCLFCSSPLFLPLSLSPLPLSLIFFSFSYLPLFFFSPFFPPPFFPFLFLFRCYMFITLLCLLFLPTSLRRSASAEVRRERSRLQREVESLKEQLATRVANEKPASSGGGMNSATKSLKKRRPLRKGHLVLPRSSLY